MVCGAPIYSKLLIEWVAWQEGRPINCIPGEVTDFLPLPASQAIYQYPEFCSK